MSSRPTPIDLPRDGDTVSVVVQRALRLLVIVAAVGVLLMHGADASAAATHETAPAVAHEHRSAGDDHGRHTVHWHHVALACVAVLSTVATVALRRRATHRLPVAAAMSVITSGWRTPSPLLLATGPPRWLDLAVIRR